MTYYIPLYRPASFATLPAGVSWSFVEAPAMTGLANRPDLPRSIHRYGVIETSRPLSLDELDRFGLIVQEAAEEPSQMHTMGDRP